SLSRGSFDALLMDRRALSDVASSVKEIRSLFPDLIIVVAADSPTWVEEMDACVSVPDELSYLDDILSSACSCRQAKLEAQQMTETLEHSREQLDRQAECIESIAWATSRWRNAVLDPPELYSSIVECFQDISGARRSSLMLVEENDREELRVVSARGLPAEIVSEATVEVGEGIAGWVAEHGSPLVQKPPGLESRAACHHTFETDQFLSLPLRAEEEIIGVQNLSERAGGERFRESEIEFFTALAHEAAAWVELSHKVHGIRKQALLDELTGVYNRRYFETALSREIERAKRSGQNLVLAMVDIDHFKRYNDIHGHPQGDEVLKDVVELIRSNIRTSDIVCRYGGEEFAVILPDTGYESTINRQKAVEIMERVRRAVEEREFTGEETQPGGTLTLSAGIGLFRQDAMDAEGLVEHADQSMYEAKKAGRNRVMSGSEVTDA
ncbi:MAG: sensor domain-containing diguanylate cyclase, partial [Planctomycetota bacterium]